MPPQSLCRMGGWLHDYKIVAELPNGVAEVCRKCKKKMFFRTTIPNHIYIKHHVKSVLQPNHPRFIKENNNYGTQNRHNL